MFGNCECRKLTGNGSARFLSRVSSLLPPGSRVTVLLFLSAGLTLMFAQPARLRAAKSNTEGSPTQDSTAESLRACDFSCEFYLPMGPGRLEGRIVSDASRSRIAIYWIEPGIYRESPFFVRYADLFFTPVSVSYWIYGASQTLTLDLRGLGEDSLLPRQRSPASIVRSALALVNRIRDNHNATGSPLEVAAFFNGARGHAQHTHEAAASAEPARVGSSDIEVLNALPYGRMYVRETRSDGLLVWRERKALNGRPIANVTVKPLANMERICPSDVFDAQTLGQWTLVPEPYRAYWSFDRSYLQLKESTEEHLASCDLYDKIDRYLEDSEVPPEVRRALDRLCFKTALLTGDGERVHRSAQASIAGLCRGDLADAHQSLLELARISGQLKQYYPQQARERLRPLVREMVEHVGPDAVADLDRLLPAVTANRWFTYGSLLLDEIRQQGLMKQDAIATLTARFDATRMAASQGPPDPCEPYATVRQYLLQMDATTPKGAMDMNAVRRTLERGLAKCSGNADPAQEGKVVEEVIRLIRLIVGEGPFRGNADQLVASIERFSRLYLEVGKVTEPMDTVLATFLALSFCDTSTPEDHEALFLQLRGCSAELRSRLNTMLDERGLRLQVSPEDVEGVFTRFEEIFQGYIEDPLWPAFKFPWTTNEQRKLAARMKLKLMELTPELDDIALKIRYGGASAELRRRALFEISRFAQQLLPEAAFLRKPPYPGILCEYRGGYGFVAVIKGPLYQEGHRPRERFRAMKYFHLGHRLQSLVEKERELTFRTEKEEMRK